MIFCCYGRKSVYSDRSDSVDNQFRMCRDYVNVKYSGQVDDFRAYSDEDFTGANTNRPDLQRLLRISGPAAQMSLSFTNWTGCPGMSGILPISTPPWRSIG